MAELNTEGPKGWTPAVEQTLKQKALRTKVDNAIIENTKSRAWWPVGNTAGDAKEAVYSEAAKIPDLLYKAKGHLTSDKAAEILSGVVRATKRVAKLIPDRSYHEKQRNQLDGIDRSSEALEEIRKERREKGLPVSYGKADKRI